MMLIFADVNIGAIPGVDFLTPAEVVLPLVPVKTYGSRALVNRGPLPGCGRFFIRRGLALLFGTYDQISSSKHDADGDRHAQQLRGKTMELYREDISDELIFAAELVDVEVYADGACIGKIKEVLDYPGNSVYVVQGEREYLIPAVKEFVKELDLDENAMKVKLIEGMRSDEN